MTPKPTGDRDVSVRLLDVDFHAFFRPMHDTELAIGPGDEISGLVVDEANGFLRPDPFTIVFVVVFTKMDFLELTAFDVASGSVISDPLGSASKYLDYSHTDAHIGRAQSMSLDVGESAAILKAYDSYDYYYELLLMRDGDVAVFLYSQAISKVYEAELERYVEAILGRMRDPQAG